MLVVLAIMGFVIAGAYSLSMVTNRAAEVAQIQSAFTKEIGTPLQFGEKYLQQNSALDAWEDYRVTCFTDTDLDGLRERVTIQAHSDGRLTLEVWNTNIQGQDTTRRIGFTMSENNTNVADGVPLFVYLKDDGTPVETLDARASQTRNIIMQVNVEIEGKALSDERTIHFRNRM